MTLVNELESRLILVMKQANSKLINPETQINHHILYSFSSQFISDHSNEAFFGEIESIFSKRIALNKYFCFVVLYFSKHKYILSNII